MIPVMVRFCVVRSHAGTLCTNSTVHNVDVQLTVASASIRSSLNQSCPIMYYVIHMKSRKLV